MKYFGINFITILCLIPIFLWFDLNTPASNFTIFGLGQIFALIGATLLSINFALSSRLKFLEKLFGGLNKVYMIHHITGSLSIVFLSFHPVFIGLSYLPISLNTVFLILFPPIRDFAPWFGLLAYLTLSTLIILTLYVNLPYHIWKLTHKFMGVALIFAFVHVYFIPSTVSYNTPLRIYMLSVMGIGILIYFYRTLLGRYFVGRYSYKVDGVRNSENVTKIILSPLSNKMNYKPGQFIFINFSSSEVSNEEHPFSLTSSPNEPLISILPKESGDYTSKLKNLKNGTIAKIEGPFGAFSYQNSPREKQIWIAGGIGITPFVSMAKSFSHKNGYETTLYYITKTKKEAVYLKELSQLSKNLPNLKIKHLHTDTGERLTAIKVSQEISDYKKRDIFICGPTPMMKDLREQFNKLGVRNAHIITEEFSLD